MLDAGNAAADAPTVVNSGWPMKAIGQRHVVDPMPFVLCSVPRHCGDALITYHIVRHACLYQKKEEVIMAAPASNIPGEMLDCLRTQDLPHLCCTVTVPYCYCTVHTSFVQQADTPCAE